MCSQTSLSYHLIKNWQRDNEWCLGCVAVIEGNPKFSVLCSIFSQVLIEITNVNCTKEVSMPSNWMLYQPTAVICGINISACMIYLWKQSNKNECLEKRSCAICIYSSTCQSHYSFGASQYFHYQIPFLWVIVGSKHLLRAVTGVQHQWTNPSYQFWLK